LKKVELINISKSYDQKNEVISNINVTIEPGELFVLVGPSGSGKSTLLRMIAGLEEITDGILKIGDQEANLLPPSKRNISMVFQNYALYPHLTVKENIVFGLHVKKVPKEERNRRCIEVAGMLGLEPYLNRKPRALSGGQRQRVALARAIINQSPICLMDEPLSNLDAKLRAHMRSEIKQIQRQLGVTMIYVTHDQVEAMTMGDRIMILNDGKIQQIGKPLDIYNQPANPFVATFIGSPPMNIVDARIHKETSEIVIDENLRLQVPISQAEKWASDKVIVGIRPEYLKPFTNEQEGKTKIFVKVKHIEVLGTETILVFQVKDKEWSAKWSGQWKIQVGDIVPIAIDFESVCLFNDKNGATIKVSTNLENHVLEHGVVV
jgi:sn-glycerol 3-phosphate transport system ATP-binding protein